MESPSLEDHLATEGSVAEILWRIDGGYESLRRALFDSVDATSDGYRVFLDVLVHYVEVHPSDGERVLAILDMVTGFAAEERHFDPFGTIGERYRLDRSGYRSQWAADPGGFARTIDAWTLRYARRLAGTAGLDEGETVDRSLQESSDRDTFLGEEVERSLRKCSCAP